MQPGVTVLIPVRNGERFLAEAIDSVYEQTFTNWTLIIRNNCSRDGTRAVAEKRLADPRVRLIDGDTDLSMAENFNRCLDEVRSKYYTLLCHDDYFYSPAAIAAAYEVMEGDASVPTVYSDLVYVTGERRLIARRRFGRSGLVEASRLARSSVLSMRNWFGIPVLARTAALGDRRYDESLPYIIDLDLSIATAHGGKVYHIPEPLIANRYHGENRTGSLIGGVMPQMVTLAARHGIPLTKLDRLRMRVSAWHTGIAKQAFMLYARNLNRAFWTRTRNDAQPADAAR